VKELITMNAAVKLYAVFLLLLA